jgi:hypothetical protein
MPIIPAAQEAKIRKITVEAIPSKQQDPISTNKTLGLVVHAQEVFTEGSWLRTS